MPKRSQIAISNQNRLLEGYIIESVESAISDLLGASVVDAFYVRLESGGVSRNEIPSKLNQFCMVVDQVFGTSALVIQRAIAKRLFSRLGFEFVPIQRGSLTDYVKRANERMSVEAE